jgi:hypothetical protein
MEQSGQLAESLTYIYQQYELISRRYDEFIGHMIAFFDQERPPVEVVSNIEYLNLEDGGLQLMFCGNTLKFNFSFVFGSPNEGRITCHKIVDGDYLLFSSFEYNEQGSTNIPTAPGITPYRINERAGAINIMLYLLKMSFSTNELNMNE